MRGHRRAECCALDRRMNAARIPDSDYADPGGSYPAEDAIPATLRGGTELWLFPLDPWTEGRRREFRCLAGRLGRSCTRHTGFRERCAQGTPQYRKDRVCLARHNNGTRQPSSFDLDTLRACRRWRQGLRVKHRSGSMRLLLDVPGGIEAMQIATARPISPEGQSAGARLRKNRAAPLRAARPLPERDSGNLFVTHA